jgi:hypothetical protein
VPARDLPRRSRPGVRQLPIGGLLSVLGWFDSGWCV